MGESREGEGGARSATTADLASHLAYVYEEDGRDIQFLSVVFITEGLYAVSVTARGESEAEQFFLKVE